MTDERHKYTYEPRALRHADVERYIWGDDESGHVVDWYHRNSDKLIMSLFSLAPGARWTHSETHKSFYDADECYYILQGSLTFHNPATGEVQVVNEGEALHFRRHTFHYGYNFGTEQVLIVAGFAPLPDDLTDAETLGSFAPRFDAPVGGRYDLLGNWPWNADEARRTEEIKVLQSRDWLHVIQGVKSPVRVSLFASTERLTMGTFTLLPGTVTDPETHPGDEVAYVAKGAAHVFLPETRQVFDLDALDAAYVPGGTPHRYVNEATEPATMLFAVAPSYR